MSIHPTAIIEPGAELGRNVRVGPYCYLGPNVRLGDGCELRPRATIVGCTTVGPGCVFFTNCVIGEIPQDLKYQGGRTETIIGQDNHFRELVTVHAGTEVGGGVTRIGDHNRFLVGVHVAHDMHVGNHVVISNNVQMAGHVHVEDFVTMGGLTAIHHFVTVGRYAMLGGFSRVTCDVPPYMISFGYPAEVRGANFPGLKRWGLAADDIEALNRAFKLLYARRSEKGPAFVQRLETLQQHNGPNPHVQYLYEFIRRTLSVGNCGRYLESQRRDTPQDSEPFYRLPEPA